jgi:hypothetical protein
MAMLNIEWKNCAIFTNYFIYIFTYMEFKPLELKTREGKFRRFIKAPHVRRTVIAVLIGASVGFALFYFSEGRAMETIPSGDIFKSILIGGFFGFFVTNSPCARGRC